MPTHSFTILAVLGCTTVGLAVRMTGEDAEDQVVETFDGDWLQEHGVTLAPAPEGHYALRYSPVEACAQGYRVSIEETMPDRVAQFFNRRPERSEAVLVLSPHEDAQTTRDPSGQPVFKGTLVFQSPDAGVRAYASTEPTPLDLERDFYSSPTTLGPAAPDAACRKRSWDAVEDALALGWPQLSPHRVRTGETWTGARVEGRCNETACLTPEGVAGASAHGPRLRLAVLARDTRRGRGRGLASLRRHRRTLAGSRGRRRHRGRSDHRASGPGEHRQRAARMERDPRATSLVADRTQDRDRVHRRVPG